jgi:hypothetical protein
MASTRRRLEAPQTLSHDGSFGAVDAAPKPPRVHVTAEDLERFGDEDLMVRASNDDWLRDEVPPHHRL